MDIDFVADHICLVWVDKNMEYYTRTKDKFRENTNTLVTFNNPQQCIRFIYQNPTKKIFLITQGMFAPYIVPAVNNCDQLESVYIFCHIVANYRFEEMQYEKIRKGGIFDIDDDLNMKLTEDIAKYLIQTTMDLQNKANSCTQKAQDLIERYRQLYQVKCTLLLNRSPDEEVPYGIQSKL
ncbi:unnamed protein product [Didymodactylos carnosus]|uniref:Uncharacterized protein n=1 Tax=Didymodactylos carnosus TaxID=1234261 RepID=A0A815QMQ1_9BILA|nr:unnamed protein product [Didymodactylos carnosus]CAF1464501.1 unnamed protein product [Didymodactylos carnosus]CAF3587442.1 unnamed protein product [Didymodactylos carnosus]CAF4333962.1 unnamed protein product [Didymodactylos carnosus]